jgi:hypothetical protein
MLHERPGHGLPTSKNLSLRTDRFLTVLTSRARSPCLLQAKKEAERKKRYAPVSKDAREALRKAG